MSITAKLFAAVLATAMVVALVMGVAAHVNLTRGFLGHLNEQALLRLDAAVPGVTAGYRQYGDWTFQTYQPDLWCRLLRPLTDDGSIDTAVMSLDRPPPTLQS